MFDIVTRGRMEAEINGRGISIQGEGFRPRPGNPDFVVYLSSIKNWADGSPVTERDLESILADLRACATAKGIVLDFE